MKHNKFLKDALIRPVMRSIVCMMFAVSWNLGSAFLLLNFLPLNFGYWNTMIANQGTNNFDVYMFWGWIPTLLILIIGIFWSSGLLGRMGEWMENL